MTGCREGPEPDPPEEELGEEPEPDGMVVTDLAAWETEEDPGEEG